MLIATALTLALLWLATGLLRRLIGDNQAKILAALQGHSWAAEREPPRLVTVRFSRPDRVAGPAFPPARLRAAA